MELTPSQAGEIDQLIEQHGEGKVEPGENGTMIFRAKDRAWSIGRRGAVTELDLSDEGASESLGGPGQALDPGVDEAPGSHSSDGPELAGKEAGDSPAQESDATPPTTGPSDEQATPDLPTPPGSGALVPTVDQLRQDERQGAYEAMSLADERQIAADIEGNALSSMIYGFRQGGSMVYGLSWIGARESVRAFNVRGAAEIRIDNSVAPQFEDVTVTTVVGYDEEAGKEIKEERPAIRCTVYGMDVKHGGGQFGTATVPRDQVRKKGKRDGKYYETTPDGFAANKALSKAQRNALEPQIPRWFVEELIALYKGQGKVEYLPGTGRELAPELPPALTDDRAKAQLAEARELYAELGKLGGRQKMPPALFNRSVEASQHDHDRLDDFLEFLRNAIAEAQA